ncbi:hypothetical protein JCM8097_003727 [Rhodosporidiobolus ruineniae]
MPFTVAQVRRRYCCFCIPARAATLLLSLLAATASAMLGIEACIRVFDPEPVSILSVWVSLAQVVVFFSLVVICLYGWGGCILQKLEWVDWFYELSWWHLWVNVLCGVFWLGCLSTSDSKQASVAVCLRNKLAAAVLAAEAGRTDAASVEAAIPTFSSGWVIAVLIELYLVLVISHYMDEIADRDAALQYGVDIESPNPPYRFVDVEQDPLVQAAYLVAEGVDDEQKPPRLD